MTGSRYLIALGATNTIVTSASVRLMLKTGVHCDGPVALCNKVLFRISHATKERHPPPRLKCYVLYLEGNVVVRRCWVVLICVILKVAGSSVVIVCYRRIGFGTVSLCGACKASSGKRRASKRLVKFDASKCQTYGVRKVRNSAWRRARGAPAGGGVRRIRV